ncbi:MAG: ATP-binding cassette domain-containing protein [Spirochaetota bacterium]
MSSAIEVKNLKKDYGSTKALKGINFDLKKEEVLAFLGPNGAGKSTAMKIITSYLDATSGDVWVNGINVRENPLKVREMIGYLPESTPLYEHMIVYDFLKFTGEVHNIPKDNLGERISEMADTCGINEVINKRIYELSKGYKQRVGLAYAMIHDPDILILDEPTSGLDPNQIIEIRNLIRELGKKKSVILSTHILSEAEAAAERAVIIHLGEIVADGTVDDIRRNNKRQNRLHIKIKNESNNSDTIKNDISSIDGVTEVKEIDSNNKVFTYEVISELNKDIREDIYTLCKEKNYLIFELREKELSLEEVFIQLTRGEVPKNYEREKRIGV